MDKKVEAGYKTTVRMYDRNKISAVEPQKYASRFQDFMFHQVFALNKIL
jgi:hypothetical protein